MWLMLALPLALEDPLPNILRAVGGIEGKAGGHALIGGLDWPLGQSAAATGGRRRGQLAPDKKQI